MLACVRGGAWSHMRRRTALSLSAMCWRSACAVRGVTHDMQQQQQQHNATMMQPQHSAMTTHDDTTAAAHTTTTVTTAAAAASAGSSSSGGVLSIGYTPGAGPGVGGLVAPTTALTAHCDVISEALSKADELEQQRKAQAAMGDGAQILTQENMDELMTELREGVMHEVATLAHAMRTTAVVRAAGMHELRRTLYYATTLHTQHAWLDAGVYTSMMRALTAELLRREADGLLAPDDVLYIATHMVAANYYNRHLWNRLEAAMARTRSFDTLELTTVKALTTKLSKTRRGCARETLDVRRKVLTAMMRRVAVLANDFDLPSLLGILQCYTQHDMSPLALEPLAIRATNHVGEYTPQECATLAHVLRRFRLLRVEVCERLVGRICTADQLNHHTAHSALVAIRACYNKISEGGRAALQAEPTRQRLRAMGEQVGCRLDEVQYPAMQVVLNVLDIVVSLKIYVPKKALQVLFDAADRMLRVVIEQRDELVDKETGKRVRPVTAEEARQLQALLLHYGADLAPELATRLKQALQDGVLPDEASL